MVSYYILVYLFNELYACESNLIQLKIKLTDCPNLILKRDDEDCEMWDYEIQLPI